MVLRLLQRWRIAPGPAVVSVAAYAFVLLSLFALAAQATGQLAGMVAQLAPALAAPSKPGAKPAGVRPAAPQKAAISVPQSRTQGSVVLTQGWSGFPGYSRDRSYWRGRERNRDARHGRDGDEDDGWRRRDSDDEDGDARPQQSTTYRTVCVRLCDGYYWPMSYATTADNFDRDRRKCESSCSSPARLYRGRTSSSDIDDMEDQNGQPYRRLKNAFLYRAQYDAACRCKAEPWSKEAMDRHKMYALEAAKAKGDKVAAQQLKDMKAAFEAERLQASAADRKAGIASATQAAATDEPDARARTVDRPAANERMGLGARSAPPSARSSAPMRSWLRLNESAP